MGIVIFVLLIFEGLFGLFLGIKITRDKITKAIPSFSTLHRIGGILLYILTKAENALGLWLYKKEWTNYLMASYVILFTWRYVQEYRYRKNDPIALGNHKMAFKEDSFNEKHRKLMISLNNNSKFFREIG